MQSAKIDEIFGYLVEKFGPAPRCELVYSADHELLIAIMLSAQCTDVRVNAVTKNLFTRYKSLKDFANANQVELEREIYSTGFYKNKARNIISMANQVIKNHGGKIPKDIDMLVGLAGVGRKTANVFLAEFYKIPAIGVDTHVSRVSKRLGFSDGNNPVHIERDLKAIFDAENWCDYHLYMVLFGRYFCTSRRPKCDECGVKKYCSFLP